MKQWDEILSHIEIEFGKEALEKWMPPLSGFDAANIYLKPKDAFQITWFEEHVRPLLKNLKSDSQRKIKVHLITHEKKITKEPIAKPICSEAALGSPPKKGDFNGQTNFTIGSRPPLTFSQSFINAELSLETFVPSDKNFVAYKLLQEENVYNPIYIFGPKSSGKTHLLNAAALFLKAKGKKVFYIRAESFTDHVVQAMRLAQMQTFRKIYREIDVLIIDDIHILAKKAATQEEFFHTFTALHTVGRLIIISGNVAPNKLQNIEPRLISRFEWGISLEIGKSPAFEIVKKKALVWNLPLSEALNHWLIEHFPSDPILALEALSFRTQGNLASQEMAEKILKDLLEKEKEEAPCFEKIVKMTALHFDLTVEDILGKSQRKACSIARQIAMYLCREKLHLPYQKIGELFDRDHSTVMSSIKQIEKGVKEKSIELPQ